MRIIQFTDVKKNKYMRIKYLWIQMRIILIDDDLIKTNHGFNDLIEMNEHQ